MASAGVKAIRGLRVLILIAAAAAMLSGCLYPEDQRRQNEVPPKDEVRNVQTAVEEYQKETGLLPIKNSTVDTPRYEKFVIDFAKLQRSGQLSQVPSASFEQGGHYYFLIIDEETAPRVKLMDLVTVQYINDLNSAVREYAGSSGGKLPIGEEVYPGYYRIDYKQLGKQEKPLRSIYSGQTVPVMMDEAGEVYADYAADLMQAVQKSGKTSFAADYDLRGLLVDNTIFAPAKSTAYRYVNGEPVAVAE